jgi:hypothetical protein
LLHLDNICFSGSRGSFSRERRRGRWGTLSKTLPYISFERF